MKKALLSIAAVAVLLTLAAVIFSDPLKQWAFDAMTDDMFVAADTDAFDAGLQVGESLPAIAAMYQGDTVRSLESFSGEKGLVVMASRSVDWCPFCIRQAIELNTVAQKFRDAGLGIVLVTYDSPDKQRAFIEQHDISYPIISDIDAQTVTALKILRPDYPPGDDNYGLPYPGSFVTTPDGLIVAKWFLEAYSVRVSAEQLLDEGLKSLGTL